jgi:5-methylcytosine-specific restriction endonuclease McrA
MAANPRISAKERGLLKGAIRRVFSRSDIRKDVIERTRITYFDPERPRVKKWSRCEMCGKATPSYQIQVDHKIPLVPVNSSLEEMSWDELINNCWCDISKLQGLDEDCHKEKTKEENRIRREFKKARGKKDGK